MVGSVTRGRYDQLVAEAVGLIEQASNGQFRLGEMALEIEPIRPRGGSQTAVGEDTGTVEESLRWFADDLGVSPHTIKTYRWVASRWPKGKRAPRVPHHIHSILASKDDEQERWSLIHHPPQDARTGTRRWTDDAARRAVQWQVRHPETVAEKVRAVHQLVDDDQVAAKVATDLLRRPTVVAKAMKDQAARAHAVHELVRNDKDAAQLAADVLRRPAVADRAMQDETARQYVNQAQVNRIARAEQEVCAELPSVAPERVGHTLGFMELVGSCHAFVSAIGRIVPGLAGRRFAQNEHDVLAANIARVRAAADWAEGAVETGNTSLDEGLAALLRGE